MRLVNNFTIDFNKLALLEPALRRDVLILSHRVVCNFATQHSLIALTRAIMRHVFALEWTCPPGNLCPRIPSRLNYLLWLHLQLPPVHRILDVGTGATLIYPLIGWALFKWRSLALEINPLSLAASRRLIDANGLHDAIELRLTSPEEETILHPTVHQEEEISLVVCNPPFFEEEAATLSAMEPQEHHTECGEYGFFFLLYKDSFRYPRIRHFSCLIGRPGDFVLIRDFLLAEERGGFLGLLRFGEIVQGKNCRFIALWSIAH